MSNISNPEPDILNLEGEIDLHESPYVREKLNPMIAKKHPAILIDLSGVTYIDSSGLAIFIDALQRMQAYGGKLLFIGVQDAVRHILEIARLDQVFKMFPDKVAARQSIG